MITPAEVIWPLIVLLLATGWRILMTVDFGEHSSIPSRQAGNPAGRARLTAEANRTDTLLWYAGQLLDHH